MIEQVTKPNCYACKHRRRIPGDAHSQCTNTVARVSGSPHWQRAGWFAWPFNFDPVWLVSCDGFAPQVSPAGSGETPTDAVVALRERAA